MFLSKNLRIFLSYSYYSYVKPILFPINCKINSYTIVTKLENYTLWPFDTDNHTHVMPPFRKRLRDGNIVDRSKPPKILHYYEEVPTIFDELQKSGILIGVASRAIHIKAVTQLTNLFGWRKIIKYKSILPGIIHNNFKLINKATRINYTDMLFFDFNKRNIEAATELKVLGFEVKNGMTLELLHFGLNEFRHRKEAIEI